MSELIKYTFEDWWNGGVNLDYENILIEIQETKPVIAMWENFEDADVQKIKVKQRHLFEEILNREFETKRNDFLNRLQISNMNRQVVNVEMQYFLNYMFSPISFKGRNESGNDISQLVQHMVQTELSLRIRGLFAEDSSNFQFIESPNSRYKLNWIHPKIQAYINFEFFHWLKFLYIPDEVMAQNSSVIKNDSTYPHPEIFSSHKAYQLFIALKDSSVRHITRKADYAFIFHKMKAACLINKDIKHRTFIKMLDKNYGADIGEEKFQYKNQESKITLFNYFLGILGLN